MIGDQDPTKLGSISERLFNRSGFAFLWVVFMGFFFTYVAWPLRNIVLVCWVLGSRAYFHEGVRVVGGKPVRFSDGTLVPAFLDIATGIGTFFVTGFGLIFLLLFSVRCYLRFAHRRRNARG